MSDESFNRRAAKKIAEEKGFDPENMVFCAECGRTAIRTQKMGNPGFKDSLFCTCSDVGYPFFPVVKDND